MPALEVKGLSKSFGSVAAAKNLNIRIQAGSIVSIIGTNGAGKTTFINMVTGYVRPDQGEIRFAGHDITGKSPREITRLGLGRSFQIPQLFSGYTVEHNILTAAAVARMRWRSMLASAAQQNLMKCCMSALNSLNLARFKDRLVEDLAGGSRKLVDIAMAIVTEPGMLLLDEPTSGVSEEEKGALMEQVLSVTKSKRLTTVLVEHDMDIVRAYSDRVLAFFAGEVIADGTPAAVLGDRRVQELIVGV